MNVKMIGKNDFRGSLFLGLVLSLSLFLVALVPGDAIAEGQHSSAALTELASKVKFYRLKNGLRVILLKRGVAPVFAGAVAVGVGGSDEPAGVTGISHMLEHMAFKGTPRIGTSDYPREKKLLAELEAIMLASEAGNNLKPDQKTRVDEIEVELKTLWGTDQFTREYERRGASGMNATTDKELTRYFVELPRPAFEFWCWIESERLLNPVMRQFYQERDVVMEERRMRYEDDPSGKLYEMLLGVAYLQHSYRNPVIGYPQDIRNLTATMVEQFQRKYYVPSNMAVSIVGDVNPDDDIAIIEKYFGRIPAGETPARPAIQEPIQEGEREVVLNSKSSPELIVAYRKPQYPDPEDPKISLMLEMLAGSTTSPLYNELVRKTQVASGVSQTEAPGSRYPNLFLFQASPRRPHSNQDVIQIFDSVLNRFKTAPIDEKRLEIAKRSVAMDYLGHFKSSMSLALDFASSELLYNDWRASLTWYEQAMKVTAQDIKEVAEKYLIPTARTVGRIETTKK